MRYAMGFVLVMMSLAGGVAHAEPCEAPHIQAHLARVEAELTSADTSHLTPTQRASRAHHVEVLRGYREACVFPHNTVAPGRITPVFVDERGVHCAVGYLMARDGRGDLVEKVRTSRNTARIQDLTGDPEIDAWLRDAGLSWFEAARIQPEYDFIECQRKRVDCLCAGVDGETAPVSAVGVGEVTSSQPPRLRVDAVYGDTAVAPGDVVSIDSSYVDDVGNRAIVLLDRDPARRIANLEVTGTSVSCTYRETRSVVPVDVYVDALRAEDCRTSLRAFDPNLGVGVCDALPTDGASGCGGSAVPSGAAFALLALLVLVRRRRRSAG